MIHEIRHHVIYFSSSEILYQQIAQKYCCFEMYFQTGELLKSDSYIGNEYYIDSDETVPEKELRAIR